MKKIYTTLVLAFATLMGFSQILSSTPAFPTQNDEITILYNATSGNAALTGVIPVYAHTGIITNNSANNNDWQHVQGNWGTADPNVVMTPLGNNLHRIIITPQDFYGLGVGETATRLMFVFRNQNGSTVGRNADASDIYLNLYPEGFNAGFTSPGAPVVTTDPGQNVSVVCGASIASDISISVNGTQMNSGNGITTLNYTFNEANAGEYLVEMTATYDGSTITDQLTIIVLPTPNVAASPAGVIDGINYIDDDTVILQFYAPNKDYIFVIGDFNEWQIDLDYMMNRTPDGSTYWIELNGLTSGQEYRFQYLIDDQQMRVAEIYAEKILSPWDDQYIPESTYPNLIDYPVGLTSEPVSIFQINEPEFNWTDASYVRPSKDRLVIYETLVRDFVEAQNYQTLTDTLDYFERLGITAIQLMPIMEFEGNNSWGYNPAWFFAADKYYGSKESLKIFVNECHNRGIAVILDIALNHSFGQNPMVRMYFDPNNGQYGAPTPENPWFNQQPKHDFNVGYDFNHEAQRTRNFCKRVIQYWMDEYHVDGYRFDLSKGFTQNNTLGNIGAWNAYDQSRVNIWNDYYSFMQSVEPGSYAILEHFANNDEETALSNAGMMLWGNLNHEYSEGSMGYASNLSWGSYQNRGWNNPHLITYAESHDEERLMYKNLLFGNSNGSYNITNINTALARQELAHCFLIPIPGPKMLWQFGELGYDYSINYCENGTINESCRTAPKPIRWDYQDVEARLKVYKVTAALNNLKKTQAIFSTTNFNIDLAGFGKRIHLNGTTQNAVVVGNFNTTAINMIPGFQHTGTWYDYFTGNPIQVTDLGASFNYQPGEYHIYFDYQLPVPDISTSVEELLAITGSNLNIYPNPSQGDLTVAFRNAQAGNVRIEIVDLMGRVVFNQNQGNIPQGTQQISLATELPQGNYILRLITDNNVVSQPVIISAR